MGQMGNLTRKIGASTVKKHQKNKSGLGVSVQEKLCSQRRAKWNSGVRNS